MRPIGFKRAGLVGAVAVTLFVAPSAKAGTVTSFAAGTNGGGGATTVTMDLGNIAYGINVNASIFNPSALGQTYTYNQLLFGWE